MRYWVVVLHLTYGRVLCEWCSKVFIGIRICAHGFMIVGCHLPLHPVVVMCNALPTVELGHKGVLCEL